jgi:hypothetical protein
MLISQNKDLIAQNKELIELLKQLLQQQKLANEHLAMIQSYTGAIT